MGQGELKDAAVAFLLGYVLPNADIKSGINTTCS